VLQWLECVRLTTTSAAHRGRPSIHQERSPLLTTPPPSEDAADADCRLPMMADAPPEHRPRDYDWFMPGRYFKIWAREGNDVDIEIHEKEYILLDTKNIEGPGLLVRRLPIEQCSHEGHRGSFNRTHVLLQNHDSAASRSSTTGGQSRRKTVYLDEEEDEVADNTFIELEHTYNIPFVKYKCIDYGVLTRSSLRDLRGFYVNWLRYHWELD
jgi:hypothetical protein